MTTHHKLIKDLVKEVRRLRRDLNNAIEENESISWQAYRAEERATQARRDADYQAEESRRAQDEANYRDYQRQDIMKDLERAQAWGNDWEEQKLLDKLRRL